VVLKWAASADGFLAPAQGGPKRISGPMSDRLVHRLRAGCRGILVGTETARLDDPLLTNRHWPGRHPLRFVLDRRLRLPHHLRLFASGDAQTYVITEAPPEAPHPARLLAVDDLREVGALLRAVAGQGVDALLVEGGARLLEAFLAADAWQAVFRIQSTRVFLGAGPAEPPLPREAPQAVWQLQDDRIAYWLC
jgi:diaminohydroxyphosphoribosylaminopyrimidine deaminase/5-amino-6-(5-phosphoribosylamino)uracil reductase